MYIRDEKKVESLIKGLETEKVTVTNLSEYFGRQCIFMDVHQRNWADKKVSISDVLLQNEVSDETMEFFSKYKNRTLISIFPNVTMKKINSIFMSIRQKRNQCSFGRNGLMTADLYKEAFKPFFEEKKEELAEAVESLTTHYDTYVEAFKEGFERMLRDVKIEEDKVISITKSVYSQIPDKSKLPQMFDIWIDLKAYPVVSSISILDADLSDDVKDSIADTAIQAAYDILGTNLADAFEVCNNLLKYYKNALHFKDSDKKKVQILSAKLAKNNLLKNAMVSELSRDLKEVISPITTDDEIAEVLENTLAKTYQFAKETEVLDALTLKDCVLDESDLKMYTV